MILLIVNNKSLNVLKKKLLNIIKNMTEIFLDTETTGLSFKDGHRIVEIACIETKDLIPTNKNFSCVVESKERCPRRGF